MNKVNYPANRAIAADLGLILDEFPAVVLLGPRPVGNFAWAGVRESGWTRRHAGTHFFQERELLAENGLTDALDDQSTRQNRHGMRGGFPLSYLAKTEAAKDVGASRKLLIGPVSDSYPAKEGIEVVPPIEAVRLVGQRH